MNCAQGRRPDPMSAQANGLGPRATSFHRSPNGADLILLAGNTSIEVIVRKKPPSGHPVSLC
jgi:hypothetical protein